VKRGLPLLGLAAAIACASPGPAAAPVRLTIPAGASFRAVTDSLVAHGLVGSPRWFRTIARLRGTDRDVQAGVYDVPAGTGAWKLLTLLASGRVATTRFTAPEGLSLVEMASLASARLDIPAESVLAAGRDPALRREFGVEAPTLEGYLLPETYTLALPVDARGLLRAMLEQFGQHWKPGWDARLDSLGMSRQQLLVLASIVEGEARHDDERAVIAGVYHNRLRLGMPLQADPTVQYAIEQATGVRKTRLLFKDYDFPSPYNTYLHNGLPPGPVDSPGVKSIEAALYPASVPWLYFVADSGGRHRFSRTLAEHNRAVGEVHRRAARASGPAEGR
jgi:UPF0755 protein